MKQKKCFNSNNKTKKNNLTSVEAPVNRDCEAQVINPADDYLWIYLGAILYLILFKIWFYPLFILNAMGAYPTVEPNLVNAIEAIIHKE